VDLPTAYFHSGLDRLDLKQRWSLGFLLSFGLLLFLSALGSAAADCPAYLAYNPHQVLVDILRKIWHIPVFPGDNPSLL
jgi:hypothetical protein